MAKKTRYEKECEEYDKAAEEQAPGRVIVLVDGPLRMLKAGETAPKRNPTGGR